MLGRTQKKASRRGNGGTNEGVARGLQGRAKRKTVDSVGASKVELYDGFTRDETDLGHDIDDYCPRFYATQEELVKLLRKSRKWMSISEITKKMSSNTFLGDALNSLVFMEIVEESGSILIPKYRLSKVPPAPRTTKMCSKCRKPKPLAEFEREWTGRPAKTCGKCREMALKLAKKKRKTS